MVKTLLPTQGVPDQGAKIPYASRPKNQNINKISNIVTNSVKTLKTVHIKKRKLKKIKEE